MNYERFISLLVTIALIFIATFKFHLILLFSGLGFCFLNHRYCSWRLIMLTIYIILIFITVEAFDLYCGLGWLLLTYI